MRPHHSRPQSNRRSGRNTHPCPCPGIRSGPRSMFQGQLGKHLAWFQLGCHRSCPNRRRSIALGPKAIGLLHHRPCSTAGPWYPMHHHHPYRDIRTDPGRVAPNTDASIRSLCCRPRSAGVRVPVTVSVLAPVSVEGRVAQGARAGIRLDARRVVPVTVAIPIGPLSGDGREGIRTIDGGPRTARIGVPITIRVRTSSSIMDGESKGVRASIDRIDGPVEIRIGDGIDEG